MRRSERTRVLARRAGERAEGLALVCLALAVAIGVTVLRALHGLGG